MNKIKIFQNEQFGEVRIAMNENEEPLFCLADVCKVLELRVDAVQSRIKDAPIRFGVIDSMGRAQQMNFVTEKNLYKVIMRSDNHKPNLSKIGYVAKFFHLSANMAAILQPSKMILPKKLWHVR